MGRAVRRPQVANHATLARWVYGRLVAAGRPPGRPLRWSRSGPVVRRYASPYRGGGLKGRRGWLVVGALMGRAVRRAQVAKSCHIDQLGIWPTCSRRAASHCCPFWQPSCAFRWSAPDGPKRPLGRPLRTRPQAVDYLLSPGCDFVGDVL